MMLSMKKNSIFNILVVLFVFGAVTNANAEKAVLAGGCFWCVETPYDDLEGVKSSVSGYTGGKMANPTYRQVVSGQTEHIESVQLDFDPSKISYVDLLKIYILNINPTDSKGQFADRGANYRPAVFYVNEIQKKITEKFFALLNEAKIFEKAIGVEILPFKVFYNAEDYHQNYHKKNPTKYKLYRFRSGRASYLEKVWTDANKAQLEKIIKELKNEFL